MNRVRYISLRFRLRFQLLNSPEEIRSFQHWDHFWSLPMLTSMRFTNVSCKEYLPPKVLTTFFISLTSKQPKIPLTYVASLWYVFSHKELQTSRWCFYGLNVIIHMWWCFLIQRAWLKRLFSFQKSEFLNCYQLWKPMGRPVGIYLGCNTFKMLLLCLGFYL